VFAFCHRRNIGTLTSTCERLSVSFSGSMATLKATGYRMGPGLNWKALEELVYSITEMLVKKADALSKHLKERMTVDLKVAGRVLTLRARKNHFHGTRNMGLMELLDVYDYSALKRLYKHRVTLKNLGRKRKAEDERGLATNCEDMKEPKESGEESPAEVPIEKQKPAPLGHNNDSEVVTCLAH